MLGIKVSPQSFNNLTLSPGKQSSCLPGLPCLPANAWYHGVTATGIIPYHIAYHTAHIMDNIYLRPGAVKPFLLDVFETEIATTAMRI